MSRTPVRPALCLFLVTACGNGGQGGSPTDVVGLDISPDDPVLDASNGARPSQQFTVTATQRDGATRDVTGEVAYALAEPLFGDVATGGLFTSEGVAGQTRLRATLTDGSGHSVNTSITVNRNERLLGEGVTPADVDRYQGAPADADPAAGPRIDYPLANAVMPLNVHAPKVMWTPQHPSAADTDLIRVQLVRPNFTLEGFFLATPAFQHAWRLPDPEWKAFAASNLGAPIEVTVGILATASGTRYESAPLPFETIDAVIAGSVYYWSPPASRLRRVDVESAALVDFMPNPNAGCIGCHSVSRDGRRLSGFLEGGTESLAAYDLTIDLTASPAPELYRVNAGVRRCTSYSGDASRLVSGDCGANPTGRSLSIIDTATGLELTALAGLPGDGFDPEWSPDSSAIAYSSRDDDLMLTRVTGADAFSAPEVLFDADVANGGQVAWHPTWSPDASWLVFQHGETRRTAVETGGGLHGVNGWLEILARDGGAPVRLDNANGGPGLEQKAYRPVFSPFDSGGHFWLLFTSPRDYGNEWAGVHGQKQIWVTAVRDDPDGATNPSGVPYYLDGQEVSTVLSPYWAPPPCRPSGSDCSQSSECCSSFCDSGETCAPDPDTCRERGQSCGGAGECCDNLTCTDANICDLMID